MLEGLLADIVPYNNAYVDQMHRFWNNASRIWSTVGDVTPKSRAQVQVMFDSQMAGPEPGYAEARFMMRAKNGTIIGEISLWIVEHHRFAWVGAWIGEPDYWGGGHGTDALLLIAEYGFRWLDLHRLTLSTMAINERARRNVEKCGFQLERRAREATVVDGRPVDTVQYGLLADQWPGREAIIAKIGLKARS